MKRSELIFSTITVPLDYLSLILAAISAYLLRYLPAIQKIRPVTFDVRFEQYFQLILVIALGWIFIFALAGLYAIGGTKKIRDELAKIFVGCLGGLALILGIMVFSRYIFESRFIILSAWVLAIIYVTVERLLVRLVQRLAFRFGIGVHRVVIIGNGQIAKNLKDEFLSRLMLGYKVISQKENFNPTVAEELKDMVKKDKFDEIIQINPNLSIAESTALINFVNDWHLTYKYTADLLGTRLTNLDINTISGVPVVEVKKTRLDGWGRVYKRIFDIIISFLLAIITLPIMIVIAVAIKIDSVGPVFFKYQRIGQNGKHFIYFKFRSMVKDAHKYRFDEDFLKTHKNLRDGSPMLKFANDPRITRVGRFIRRWSLDELPELFLVLIGKMSLVGPRPHEVEEVQNYQRHHKKLLTVKPGMTGLAQVSGRSDLNFEDEVKLDVYYIENWSLGLDLSIIFKTPLAITKRRKAE